MYGNIDKLKLELFRQKFAHIHVTKHAMDNIKDRKIKITNSDFTKIKFFLMDKQNINYPIRICLDKKYSLIVNPSENVIITAYQGVKEVPNTISFEI